MAESLACDAVEFDLRQTRDGEAVLFHDEDIVLGTQRIPVRTFTAREIEKLQLPSEFGPYRIPKLEDVFHRYGHALRYVVEVKTSPADAARADGAPRRAASRRSSACARRCLVASFDAEFLRKMREVDAEIATSFLIDHAVALPEPGKLTPLFPPVDAIGPRCDLVTPALVAQAAAAGLSVHPWTADEPAEIRRLLSLGVASITTNVPEIGARLRDRRASEQLPRGARAERDDAEPALSPCRLNAGRAGLRSTSSPESSGACRRRPRAAAPVIPAASSDARKSTVRATSRGQSFWESGEERSTSAVSSVWLSTAPGQTALTAMLFPRNSRARLCVRPMTPNFAALCADRFASPRRPWTEETLTMRPRRALDHSRAGRRGRSSPSPVRFVEITRSQSAGVSFRNGLQRNIPALLTRTSMGPSSASARSHRPLRVARGA